MVCIIYENDVQFCLFFIMLVLGFVFPFFHEFYLFREAKLDTYSCTHAVYSSTQLLLLIYPFDCFLFSF